MNDPKPLPYVIRIWIGIKVLARLLRRSRADAADEPEPEIEPGRHYGETPSAETAEAAGAHRSAGSDPQAEVGVAAALLLAGVAGVAFCVIYVADHADTQLLGLALGVGLLTIAGALIVAGSRIVPQETAVEARPVLAERHRPEEQGVAEDLAGGVQGVSRRRMLFGAAGVASTGIGAAALVPLASLGPNVRETMDTTPWKPGKVLVTEEGTAVMAAEVIQGSFITAFPKGADKRELGSPIVVVRVEPATLRLPAGRRDWAPGGLLAYSKICTHAGCAISLYRSPLSPTTTSDGPALVCPCHYSTFDVLDGGQVEFGPAGRPLPQLPLAIRSDGVLTANGGFSGPIGPAWWSVRREGPTRS